MTKPTHRIKETGVELISVTAHVMKCGDFYFTTEQIKSLGLTIEPIEQEKKKLYAHEIGESIITISDSMIYSTPEIKFFDKEMPHGKRRPEYDIEYPEE